MIKITKFTRQDNHKKPKLGDKWRRPKGLQSKMRLGFKGYKSSPSAGHGSPKSTRGKHSSGLIPVVVSTPTQLDELKKDEHGVIVSGKAGMKKAVLIIKKAMELGLKVLNHDSDAKLKKVDDAMAARKKTKDSASKTKKSKLEERKKKAEEKEKEEKEEVSEEDQKKVEKKEIDKILTTKAE